MTKKLYIPMGARRAAEEALKNLTNLYAGNKYKIVRRPGYRYSLEKV
jgi:hypothetical protein